MAETGWTPGAISGATLAGLAITALMLKGELGSGETSELTVLGRASGRRVGFASPADGAVPGPLEQVAVQAGHLGLSALAGAIYAKVFSPRTSILGSGLGFGLGFYTLAHVATGPALGIKSPEWEQPRDAVAQHVVVHVVFGLLTALGARIGVAASRKR